LIFFLFWYKQKGCVIKTFVALLTLFPVKVFNILIWANFYDKRDIKNVNKNVET